MPTIRVLVEAVGGETLLAASLPAGVAHACGGHARCSTCRVEV
jgi:ferredoxin